VKILTKEELKINYKETLTPEQYRITREGGTETPYTGKYCSLFEPGTYLCVCCGTPLFHSDSKYDSGSGWPDFHEAITGNIIQYIDDFRSGKKQVEVKCNHCDAHLGHVFEDGPPPDFKRY
jgi:peptide-methionine (R)-S-oxide reductase